MNWRAYDAEQLARWNAMTTAQQVAERRRIAATYPQDHEQRKQIERQAEYAEKQIKKK